MSKINELGGYLIINLLILLKKYIIHRNKDMAFYFIKAENSTQAIKTLTPIQTELKEVGIGARKLEFYIRPLYTSRYKNCHKNPFRNKMPFNAEYITFSQRFPNFFGWKRL